MYPRYYVYFGPSPFYEGRRLAGAEKGLAPNLAAAGRSRSDLANMRHWIPEGVEEQMDSDMPLAANDVVHIEPLSNVPNIAPELVREDRDEVVAPLEMRDDNAISEDSLEGQEVLVDVDMNILRESVSAPSAIGILVSIDDRIEGTEGFR
ncbi:hypothetical protein FIBSPDRAFT_905342 [Athelia psychrophila]|uniref:Uncharacterized protein n=1 Tax=Athelia psychrophila TaxID=1759441 RepID=A0A167TJN6_9AGAM|nr:hypothetical protein FIBSPDRAFT_905342 [Fibularhizoctonia sp. CBS 109695]